MLVLLMKMDRFLILFILKFLTCSLIIQILHGSCVKITTDQVSYHGTTKQYGYNNVSVFLGIPFSKPPIDHLRFEPPQEIKPEVADVDAREFKPSCLQDKAAFLNSFPLNSRTTSEDCLYLNMYIPIPETETSSGQNVMIWIHGGGFQYGSGNVFDGMRMAVESNAIVVTINYRLGVFGFFRVPPTIRNLGLLDQNLALKWVHRNIRYFGGDPQKVTLIGEDSGGSSVCLHIISPLSQGLFSTAISHGGLDFLRLFQTNPQVNSHILMAVSECINNAKQNGVECLRNLDGETLLKLTQNENMFGAFMPTIGGNFLPSDPSELFERGNYSTTPYLIGIADSRDSPYSNHSENTENLRVKFLSEAQKMSRHHSQLITETVYYLLLSFYNISQTEREEKTSNPFSEMFKAKTTSQSLRIAKLSSSKSDTYLYTYRQNEVQSGPSFERIKSIWMSFTKSGQPSDLGNNLPSLKVEDKYLEIKHNASNIRNLTDILADNEQLLWLKVIPNILNILPPVRYDEIDAIKGVVPADQMQLELKQVFLTEWGLTKKQVEGLLISSVLALLFVCIICLGLVRMLLNPPVVQSQLNPKSRQDSLHSFVKHSYDNDAFSFNNSNRESVTSIELKDSK